MPRGGSDPPPPELGHMVPRGVRPSPSESRNGGTVTHHSWQRNATLTAATLSPHTELV
jgi:hypothetical protein